MTKRMVPISRNALKSPKSLKATDSNGINAIKAPTVVILPTISGTIISRNVCFILIACFECVIRCNG